MTATDLPATCENCEAALQGPYCHACGQHAANPLRHFAHAVEEVFESFWHLDGRVFRTLRDLFVPGRVACNYLAGQRVRYIAPLRLFVILTLITFFVGRLMAGSVETAPVKDVDVQLGTAEDETRRFAKAGTAAEVEAIMKRELADIAKARRETAGMPFMGTALDTAEAEVRRGAAERLRALGVSAAVVAERTTATAPVEGAVARRATGTPAPPAKRTAETGVDGLLQMLDSARLRDPAKPWHEKDNPADVSWLPAFGDRWFNHRLANMQANIERLENGGGAQLLGQYMLAAVPSALFLLVPVFALLLRVLYPRSRWGYLEHLVVALYSHCYLLVTLGLTFALVMLTEVSGVFGVPIFLLWVWAPVYLFLMQRRVYGQHWLATVAKFVVIGIAYQFLIGLGAFYSAFAGLSSGL
ncbi:DUF3667 domain-containing protein [Lysobacter humi (ex Lee et al. 2017)]